MVQPTLERPAASDDLQVQLRLLDQTLANCGVADLWRSFIVSEYERASRVTFGGQALYVRANDKRERNARIRAEFNGTNLKEICEKYGVQKSTVYNVVGRREPKG
jgi:Mor family transcriptional regulator